MKKGIIISIILFSFRLGYSQTLDSTSIFDTRFYTFSYFGNNLLKPGLKFGVNIILTENTTKKDKTRKSGKTIDKSNTKQLLLDGNIGFFGHPKSHIGVFNYYEFTYRIIKLKTNKYRKISIGPGIYRSFYPETYKVDNTGNVNKIFFAGRTYFAPVLTFGTGKFIKDSFIKSRTFSTNLMFLFDYNTGIVPLLNLELAFTFDFKNQK